MNQDMMLAYLKNDPKVCAWFNGYWTDIEELQRWKGHQHQWPRQRIVEKLLYVSQQEKLENPQSIKNIQALGHDDCYAIVAGQQPALGGGPLYSLIKAAQCVALAQNLNHRGVKAVPLFWCASEDHDEGEANHADFLSNDGELSRLQVPFDHPGASLQFQHADTWWPKLIESLEHIFGEAIGRQWFLKCEPQPDESTGQWMCRIFSNIFAKSGLICVEAHHLRTLWQSHLSHLVDHWPSLPLAKRRKEIMDAGYADSFGGLLHQAPLFTDTEDGRSAIKNMNQLKHNNWQQEYNPNSISTGAGLRPIVQQIALPVLAFIGGPGELHYHAFLGPAYDAFKVPMPLFIPRNQLSIIPPSMKRKIEAWQLDPENIVPDMPPPVLPPLSTQVDDVIMRIHQEIESLTHIELVDKNLHSRVETGHKQLSKALHKLRQSLERAKRQQQQLTPFGNITQYLFPRGSRQDRVVNLSQALWLYGPGIGETLVKQLREMNPGDHRHLIP